MIEPVYIVVCVMLACGCVVFWRFSGVMSTIAQSAARAAERQAAHRERFLQQCMEMLQVDGDPKDALKLAHLHAQEATQANAAQLHRDALSDHEEKSRKQQIKSVVREMNRVDDPDWSDKDAQG